MIPPDPQSLFLLVDAVTRDQQYAESNVRHMRMDDVPVARRRNWSRRTLGRALIHLGTRLDNSAAPVTRLEPAG